MNPSENLDRHELSYYYVKSLNLQSAGLTPVMIVDSNFSVSYGNRSAFKSVIQKNGEGKHEC